MLDKVSQPPVSSNDRPPVNPELLKKARQLLMDPQLLCHYIDAVNLLGVIGERRNIGIILSTVISCLLLPESGSPMAIALKLAGHQGAGKSQALSATLKLLPPDRYVPLTNGSPKCLYNLTDLKHKVLNMTEADPIKNSVLGHAVRCLISEGELNYSVSEKAVGGGYVTRTKRVEGPTAFITSTILDKLECQLDDRMITIEPDISVEQTQQIVQYRARRAARQVPVLSVEEQDLWQILYSLLQPVRVLIPFAPQISDFLIRTPLPIYLRRSSQRLFALVASITCLYQLQRVRDVNGFVVADMADYAMAHQLFRFVFQTRTEPLSEISQRRLRFIKEQGRVQIRTLRQVEWCGRETLRKWVQSMIEKSQLVWCDEVGNLFASKAAEDYAKHCGKIYIKPAEEHDLNATVGLPSPYHLTQDPRWNAEGEWMRRYDLRLDQAGPTPGDRPR